jgi:hypothetical protein
MREILRLGAPLTDLSQIGKMRDAYPLVIARVEHVIQLFQEDANAEAVAWLPLCLCFNAIRLDTITRETRDFMLQISWHMVWELDDRKKSKVDKNPAIPRKKQKKLVIAHFFDRNL